MIGFQLSKDMDVLKKLSNYVRSFNNRPIDFEVLHCDILVEFGLGNNEWLRRIYKIRSLWMPTYFRDTFVS